MKRWAESTTIHGPGHAVSGESNRLFVLWILLIIVGFLATISLTFGQFKAYFDGKVLTKIDQNFHLDTVRITYCSDDWIDVNKVKTSGLDIDVFAYFLSLLPGMYNKFDTGRSQEADDEYYVTGINQYYDHYNIPQGDRLRDHTTFSMTADAHGWGADEIPLQAQYNSTKNLTALAAAVVAFATEHSLDDLLKFAHYFAKEDVTLSGTKEATDAYSIYFGRFCRELEPSDVTGYLSSDTADFFVRYDYLYGNNQTADFDDYEKYPHRVAILPATKVGIPSYITQRRLYNSAVKYAPLLISMNEALSVKNFEVMKELVYDGASKNFDSFHDEITEIMQDVVVTMRFTLETEQLTKPNAGQAPCIEQEEYGHLPHQYRQWECEEECMDEQNKLRLESEEDCDYIRSNNLTEVANPCNCLRIPIDSNPARVLFGMCEHKQEELGNCTTNCRAELPLCRSHTTRLRLYEPARPLFRDDFSRDNPGVSHTTDNNGLTLLHIAVDIEKVTAFEEYLATQPSQLVVGLGGTAGFCMGLSVLSVVHLIISCVQQGFDSARKKMNGKH